MIILSSIYIKNFRIDASSDTLVAKNDKDFIYYNSYSKLFTSENFLVLAVKNNNEIDNKFVEKFDFLSKGILKLKCRMEEKYDTAGIKLLNKETGVSVDKFPLKVWPEIREYETQFLMEV